ncbi:MAG: DUF502 domain-containing protein [Burkholderiales bacterium]
MKKYILTGLLVWLPLAVTIWVLHWALGLLDGVFRALMGGAGALLPAAGDAWLMRLTEVPGLGVLLLLLLMLLTGMFVTNFVGQWWLRQWDLLMSRIPIVKSIYSSVKQVSDTLFSSSGQAFREAVLVQYPRQGSWTIAFVTGKPGGEVAEHLQSDYLSLYVPTTPNPTSGFFLMVPRSEVVVLQMSVDEALKYIISMGVVGPNHAAPPDSKPPLAAPAAL